MQVLKFGAVWCNGCLIMRPRWQKIESENAWLKTRYYDFDVDKDAVKRYGVDSGRLPTFIFLDEQGKELERCSGELSEIEINERIAKYKDA